MRQLFKFGAWNLRDDREALREIKKLLLEYEIIDLHYTAFDIW